MSFIKNVLIYTLVPFVYGYGYVTEYFKIKSDFKKIKQIAENHFKPFWLETNQIFQSVETKEEFFEVYLRFKKAYHDIDFLGLKINKFDYSLQNQTALNKEGLISFGLRGEHIHDIDYTLEDYFLS